MGFLKKIYLATSLSRKAFAIYRRPCTKFVVLQLSPTFGEWPTAVKNSYLQLLVQNMRTFAVFAEKYLRSKVLMALILQLRLTIQIQKGLQEAKS